jgi:hypothetical protein
MPYTLYRTITIYYISNNLLFAIADRHTEVDIHKETIDIVVCRESMR